MRLGHQGGLKLLLPSHSTHRLIEKALLGREFPKVHKIKDAPARFAGPRHRKYLHDPISNVVVAIAAYPEDPVRAYLASMLHDIVDQTVTQFKRKVDGRALRDLGL